jgi:hypothetical protein
MGGSARLALVSLVVACGLAMCGSAALAARSGAGSPPVNLKPLWSAFPLGKRLPTTGHRPENRESVEAERTSPTASETQGGDNVLLLLLAMAAASLLAGIVALAFGLRRHSTPGYGAAEAVLQLSFRRTKGGTRVTHPRRRLWARDERASDEQTREPVSSEGGPSNRSIERISGYTVKSDVDASAEPVARTEGGAAGAEPDLGVVGEEVSTVLKSAQDAAERIRSTAREHANRVVSEAKDSAAEEVAEARRIAGADRADGNRIRAEAEMYARDTRAAADAFAEQRRTEVEREAAQITVEARNRLDAVDAEVARRVRLAETEARHQVEQLQAEVKHHEERLESILVVFRGMTSQLEELLGKGAERPTGTDEGLDEALRPDPSSSHVT